MGIGLSKPVLILKYLAISGDYVVPCNASDEDFFPTGQAQWQWQFEDFSMIPFVKS